MDVRYRDRQFLRARDLRDEQCSRARRRRMHRLHPHDWGVAGGLWLSSVSGEANAGGPALVIGKGGAVDADGHWMEVTESRTLLRDALDTALASLGDSAVLCLRLARVAVDREGRSVAADGAEHQRWRDWPSLVLATGLADDPRDVSSNPLISSLPLEEAPGELHHDEPDGPRLVPLARLSLDRSNAPPTLGVEQGPSVRAWVRVAAASVRSPSSLASMRLAHDPRERRRWSVFTADAADESTRERLAVDVDLRTHLFGTTAVVRGAGLAQRMLDSDPQPTPVAGRSAALRFTPLEPPEDGEVARPWSAAMVLPSTPKTAELRFEIEEPEEGVGAENHRFIVRSGSEPVLRVSADRRVHIRKELRVPDGVIREGPIVADGTDDRFIAKAYQLLTGARLSVEITSISSQGADLKVNATIQSVGELPVSGIQVLVRASKDVVPASEEDLPYEDLVRTQVGSGIDLAPRNPLNPNDPATLKSKEFFLVGAAPETQVVAVLAYGLGPIGNTVYAIAAKNP